MTKEAKESLVKSTFVHSPKLHVQTERVKKALKKSSG